MIDGNKLILWLNDAWYASFKYEESPTSIAIKEVMKAVEEYVSEYDTELVRCKDCERRNENGWCEFIGGYVHDGYCAWAKMKGE